MKLFNTTKKPGKSDRERAVLLGLVDCYIHSGKPIGSNTLKDTGFHDLSSATIRNYFAHLDEEGYLTQQHTSGGRVPTNKAYKAYADHALINQEIPDDAQAALKKIAEQETHEIASFLEESAESLSKLTQTAVFLSAPRFDHDYIVDLKVISIDARRSLFVIITDFGVVRTEILPMEKKLSAFTTKRIEQYFHWRLSGRDKPESLTSEEETWAQTIYNELMMRFLVNYSNYYEEDIFRTGFSTLLSYPEFQNPITLSEGLSLFENATSMRQMVRECIRNGHLRYWIGEDLNHFSASSIDCAILIAPYKINQHTVGAIGMLSPTRIPYSSHFGTLNHFAQAISAALTRNLYKFKITYRQPQDAPYQLGTDHSKQLLITQSIMLSENPYKKSQELT